METMSNIQEAPILPTSSQAAIESATVSKTKVKKRKREWNDADWCAPYTSTGPYSTVEKRLHHEIVSLVDYAKPSPQELTARNHVFDFASKVVKRRFFDADVGLFGSSVTGLGLPVSDIDIAISTRTVPNKKTYFQLSSTIKNSGLTTDVYVNHRAKVPILTFKTTPPFGSFSVDIGINNTEGIRGAAIVGEYLDRMPALRPLVLVVKAFLSQRSLGSAATSGLGSYAVTCMCISFIQLNPHNRPDDYFLKPLETESLGYLLMDFFGYYSHEFPYNTSYISITKATLLPKDSERWILSKYPDRLVIQDILNSENNIASAASRIEEVKKAFKETYAVLLQTSPSGKFSLADIVKVRKESVQHKENIKALIDSGSLDMAIAQAHGHRPTIGFSNLRRGDIDLNNYERRPPRPYAEYDRQEHEYRKPYTSRDTQPSSAPSSMSLLSRMSLPLDTSYRASTTFFPTSSNRRRSQGRLPVGPRRI